MRPKDGSEWGADDEKTGTVSTNPPKSAPRKYGESLLTMADDKEEEKSGTDTKTNQERSEADNVI